MFNETHFILLNHIVFTKTKYCFFFWIRLQSVGGKEKQKVWLPSVAGKPKYKPKMTIFD